MSAEDSWRQIGYIAQSDIGDILDFTGDAICLRPGKDIPEHARRAIKSIDIDRETIEIGEGDAKKKVTTERIKIRLWDKVAANSLNLRALSELNEKVEHMGKNGGVIETTVNVVDGRAKIMSFVEEFRQSALRNLQEQHHDSKADEQEPVKETRTVHTYGHTEAAEGGTDDDPRNCRQLG